MSDHADIHFRVQSLHEAIRTGLGNGTWGKYLNCKLTIDLSIVLLILLTLSAAKIQKSAVPHFSYKENSAVGAWLGPK